MPVRRPDPLVAAWLAVVCLAILGLVVVGGITRLTGSGLSMVDWKPLLGVWPPVTDADWQARFQQYQAFPQFVVEHPTMSLHEFKAIFFWEYLHRILARSVGMLFLVPYLYFLVRRRFSGRMAGRLGFAFILGGLQGLMGWYMVKSGLVDDPQVSHFRLAAHLGLALLLFAYLLWHLLDFLPGADPAPRHEAGRCAAQLRAPVLVLFSLLVLQITYGAFVAGLKAGYLFNTFPKMLGRWIPPGLWSFEPGWSNLLHNAVTVQFIHRGLAFLLVTGTIALLLSSRHYRLNLRQQAAVYTVGGVTLLQFLLGIMTLLLVVPVGLAVWHQATACLLLGTFVFLLHSLCELKGSTRSG